MNEHEVIEAILEGVEQLREEDELSASAFARLEEIEGVLHEDIDVSLRVDRVRAILEDLDEDERVPNYVRTQLWSITALLELL